MTERFDSDIDIDVADRSKILKLVEHTPASMYKSGILTKHNSGIYVTDIPKHPTKDCASFDYEEAENRGYIKIDLLNMSVYNDVTSELHLVELMNTEPPWDKLLDKDFAERVIHISNNYEILLKMPEPVNTIPRLAMFLSIIRPGKRHLIGKEWKEIAKTVWDKPLDGSYYYKKSHAISYSHLVVVHMNLLNGI